VPKKVKEKDIVSPEPGKEEAAEGLAPEGETPEMKGKKKRKRKGREEDFTPHGLSRIHGKREFDELNKASKGKKRALWLLTGLTGPLLVLWIVSMLLTQWGDLVVSISREAHRKGLVISDNSAFGGSGPRLNGGRVEDVTNITYEWDGDEAYLYDGEPTVPGVVTIPFERLHEREGSNNGRNFLSYTFFLGNNGPDTIPVQAQLVLTGSSKSACEAARVAVIKDGRKAIYCRPNREHGGPEREGEEIWADPDEDIVMRERVWDMAPDESHRFTVVVWIEGTDPECVDDIMGGHIRMSMTFDVPPEV